MPKDCSAIDTELLLSQSGWVQSVSRNLVRDPLGAEDVAQETMLAALSSPPRYAENAQQLRAWLGKVAFNLAHRNTRRNSRRRAREVRVAKSEELSSTVEDVVRSTEMRRVSEAVAALDEPFKTAVRLYYFHRLSTAEIAERTGATDNAVRKRLWRARGKLRTLLDGSEPGRNQAAQPSRASGVLAFLFPWLGATRDSSQVATGGWTSGLAAAAGVAAVGYVAIAAFGDDLEGAPELRRPASMVIAAEDSQSVRAPRVALSYAPTSVEAETVSLPPRGEGFEPVRSRAEESQTKAPIVPEKAGVAGLLIDLRGEPVPGLRLAWTDAADEPFESDHEGRFTETADGEHADHVDNMESGRRRLTVLTPGWRVLPGLIPASPLPSEVGRLAHPRTFLVAPTAGVHGLVLAAGEPLEDVELSIRATPAVLARLPFPVGGELSVGSGGLPKGLKSALDGSFEFADVPVGPGFELVARAEGFAEESLALTTPASGQGVLLSLEPLVDPQVFLRGLVLNEWGEPLEGAEVSVGPLHSRTDREGRFRLALLQGSEADSTEELVVTKEGHRTLRRPGFWRTRVAQAGEGRTVRFQLGTLTPGEESGSARTVEGRLVDEFGRPVAGWRVAAVPMIEIPEDELATHPTIGDWGISTIAESDAEGSFHLDDLGTWTVVIRAWDPRGTRSVQSRPILPGLPGSSEVHLAVESIEQGAGQALLASLLPTTESGPRPVRFVRRFRSPTGVWDVPGPVVWAAGGRVQESAGGHVMPPTASSIATVVFEEAEPEPGDGQFGLPEAGISLVNLASFRVRSTLRGEAVSLRVLDAAGEALPLLSGPLPAVDRVWLVEGRSPLLQVQDTARSLVIYREGREVSRLEVELSSDSVTILRP